MGAGLFVLVEFALVVPVLAVPVPVLAVAGVDRLRIPLSADHDSADVVHAFAVGFFLWLLAPAPDLLCVAAAGFVDFADFCNALVAEDKNWLHCQLLNRPPSQL